MAETEKKKADYTNSAENLCNPDQVRDLIVERQRLENLIDGCKEELKANEVYLQLEDHERSLGELTGKIKETIDLFGSFQDIEAGVYALKYRRMTKSYDVDAFKRNYPSFVPAVVTETLNVKAIEGLIKGKLLDEEALKLNKILTETPTFAYYIR